MRNLLIETIECLKSHGKTSEDVRWVGSKLYGYFSWDVFTKLSDQEYHAGYGGAEVATDLLVVGDNWWLERGEYDGSEWWEFKSYPNKPNNEVMPKTVFRENYESSLGH